MLHKVFGHTLIAELFDKAGWVAIPLGICSILALGVFFERLFTYSRLRAAEDTAYQALFTALTNADTARIADPALASAPVTHILNTLTALRGVSPESMQQAADIAYGVQRLRLRRYLSTLATIGNIAPYIGLFGTVLGVQAAFATLSSSGAGADKMSGGISEALSATALGLLVAIPSVIAYNFLLGELQKHLLQIQGHVAHLLPLLHTGGVRERERV
jgi:biopolymer transport protein ExbB